jgi:hypothetical protein
LKLERKFALAIMLILVVAGSFFMFTRNQLLYSSVERTRPFKAALIDEVSQTIPDPYLISNVTNALTRVGYTVDYYGPNDVTVDFFKALPSRGYGVVILRNHSAALTGDVIALVTSEPFDPRRFVSEQQAGLVVEARLGSSNTTYFGITPIFVREAMQGTFPNTILVLTGCAGLADSEMAQAFVTRGAEVYISWDQIVLANQSDGGAILLIQSMTTGHTVDDAVASATENAPSSPLYSSQLKYYPLDKGGVVLGLQA